jgi:transglutaminase-like putative cysteine protease
MINTILRLILLTGLLQAAIAQTVPEQPVPANVTFEKANAIVKFDSTRIVVQKDGKTEVLKHYRVAVLTDRAIRDYAQDQTVYNLGYDTVEVLTARVHLPSGKVVDVSGDAIKDVPMPAFGKFFLQNVREKIITFPELVQGAEIEVAYRETTREVPMDGQYDYVDGFQSEDPIQHKYVEMITPKDKPITWKARGGEIPYTKTDMGESVRHVWSLDNIEQVIPEPGMPPAPEVVKMLLVTTVPNWETWSTWYDKLCEPMMVADDSVKAAAHDLTAGKTTAEDKLNAIFYYCSNNIRYVETALTGRKAGYKPEAAATTMRNKYGVCRDKAALMVTMLREVGIPADITLMNPSWKIDKDVPADQFNHAIVTAYINGKKIYVDPTVEKTKDYLAGSEQDRGVLTCNKKGEDLAFTPLEPSEQNLFQIKANSRLDQDGVFWSDVTITTHGMPDLIFRSFLQAMQPSQRKDIFKQLVQRVHPTAQLDSMAVGDLMDFSKTVEIKLSFHAADYSIPAGAYLLFKVPGQADGFDFLSPFLLNGSDMTNRRYDLRLQSTFAVRMWENVTYPKGYKVRSLPEKLDLNYGEFRSAREFTAGANSLTVKRALDFSGLNIPLSKYEKLQEVLKAGDKMSRGQVVLVKG